jgi:hypothetical protein
MQELNSETDEALSDLVEAAFKGRIKEGEEFLGALLAIVQDEVDDQVRRAIRRGVRRANKR